MESWTEVLHITSRVLEASPLLPLLSVRLRRNTIPPKLNLVLHYIRAESFFYILTTVSRPILRNDTYVTHISTVVTVWLLANTYRRLMPSKVLRTSITAGIGVFLLIAFADAIFLSQKFTYLNSYSQAFGSSLLITLALLHLLRLSRTSLCLENHADFFLSITTLVYFSYTIVTYVAINIIYSSGYDKATTIQLDRLISAPDALLYAVHMGLLAWMFSFFPLSVNPRRALPYWLHYSRWKKPVYKLLGNKIL